MKEKAYLSSGEVAKALGVSTITIHRYSAAGLLPSLKLGTGDARSPRRYRASDDVFPSALSPSSR